eukprot:2302581-Prymnesium_polylepis.1
MSDDRRTESVASAMASKLYAIEHAIEGATHAFVHPLLSTNAHGTLSPGLIAGEKVEYVCTFSPYSDTSIGQRFVHEKHGPGTVVEQAHVSAEVALQAAAAAQHPRRPQVGERTEARGDAQAAAVQGPAGVQQPPRQDCNRHDRDGGVHLQAEPHQAVRGDELRAGGQRHRHPAGAAPSSRQARRTAGDAPHAALRVRALGPPQRLGTADRLSAWAPLTRRVVRTRRRASRSTSTRGRRSSTTTTRGTARRWSRCRRAGSARAPVFGDVRVPCVRLMSVDVPCPHPRPHAHIVCADVNGTRVGTRRVDGWPCRVAGAQPGLDAHGALPVQVVVSERALDARRRG